MGWVIIGRRFEDVMIRIAAIIIKNCNIVDFNGKLTKFVSPADRAFNRLVNSLRGSVYRTHSLESVSWRSAAAQAG